MNKESFLSFLGILVVVILGVFIYYAVTGVKDLDIEDSNTNNTVINDNNSTNNNTVDEGTEYGSSLQEYTFKNDYGSGDKEVTIKAKKCSSLKGFTGAASNIFYIDWEDKLHYLELAYLEDKVIATNIVDFEVTNDGLIAYYNDSYDKVSDNEYVVYKKK